MGKTTLFLLLSGFLSISIANASERYIVVLKDAPQVSTFSNLKTSKIKALMKRTTYSLLGKLQSGQNALSTNPVLKIQNVLWGINGFVADLSDAQVSQLAQSPLVADVRRDRMVTLDLPRPEARIEDETAKATYGLELTNVVALRQAKPEMTGKGVVVGVIDTGIDPEHPELKGKVLAFRDFIGGKKDAYDDNGHGTHVSGTIAGGEVGGTAIGVAPEAKIISAKIFDKDGYAYESGILSAMQWMLDPDDKPETDDQPAVVSNSWGGDQDSAKTLKDDPYYKMVNSWIAAGIFPSFAAGNSGPSAGTVGVPGGLPAAFAVGAVDSLSKIASFSSRGPIEWRWDASSPLKKFLKPELVAPGVKVYSSVPGGGYASYSGTSMATPHNSGIVALVKQANPLLGVGEIKYILLTTTKKLNGSTGRDNTYGEGLIDAKAAVLKSLGE